MEAILEGLLYVQGDLGLTVEQVMNVLEISEEEAKNLILKLKKDYDNDNRGLRINFLANSFKLTTKEEHKEYYQKLLENPKTHTLSQGALETLAIIAYNEPVTRNQIDELRGVDSIYVLRRLVAKGLVKEAGRAEVPGRPILYKTTDDFLDYFGLSSLNDLPEIKVLEEEKEEDKDLFNSRYVEESEDSEHS